MAEKILVLKSGRCSWGGCVFCGYGRIAGSVPSTADLESIFNRFFDEVTEGDTVKVFGSGSFLDTRQVPTGARSHFIGLCRDKKAGRICIESRPEYVTPEILSEFAGLDLSIGIGLETADDRLLEKIKKGFGLEDYEKAAKTIHGAGFKLRSYILVNPPYTRDIQKTLDKSVEYALEHSDSMVLINMLPHGNTPLFRMWLTGEWNYLSRDEFYSVTDKWKDNPKIELDAETFRFTPRFPKEVMTRLKGVGEEYLTHPHFEVWQDFLQRWYQPPEDRDVLLFLPCSYTKPYSQSKTHRGIIETLEKTGLRRRIHEVMISNTGLVPRQFEDNYPFNAYDWDESLETEGIKQRYIEVTKERIKKYLQAHKDKYGEIFCFLKYDSESYQALTQACAELGVECVNLLTTETYEKVKGGKALQQEEALADLYDNIIEQIKQR